MNSTLEVFWNLIFFFQKSLKYGHLTNLYEQKIYTWQFVCISLCIQTYNTITSYSVQIKGWKMKRYRGWSTRMCTTCMMLYDTYTLDMGWKIVSLLEFSISCPSLFMLILCQELFRPEVAKPYKTHPFSFSH